MLQKFRRYLFYKAWADGLSFGKHMLYWRKFMYKVKILIFELDINVENCETPSVKHVQP